jgi:Zn-dependent protease
MPIGAMTEGTQVLFMLIALFLGIGVHEYAHAAVADAAGDPTPRSYGRVTLNLFNHFDPIGAIFILMTTLSGFGIGWGRPVPMDPRKMRNPKWDHFWAVFAGPLSNMMQALIFALVGRLIAKMAPDAELFVAFCLVASVVNISLFLFNLIPLGPLDGMWIWGTFLPDRTRLKWTRWNLTVGQFFLLGIVLIGQMVPGISLIALVLRPFMNQMIRILWGH